MRADTVLSRAIVFDSDQPRRFEVRRFEIPATAGPGQALIRTHLAGICGSDVHQFARPSAYGVVIPGHEMVGEIVSLGEGFEEASGKPLKVGDRVVPESTVPCMRCATCRGFGSRYDKLVDYDSCEDYLIVGKIALGEPANMAGTYADYMQAGPNVFVHRIDEDVTDDEAVLLEPLAVGVKAVLKAGVGLGDVVLVEGPGPIGLSCAIAASYGGAAQVIVTGVDGDESRLALAEELGATATINVMREDPLEALLALTGGRKADRVIDCSGARPAFDLGLRLTARNGVFTMVGGYPEDSQLILPFNYCFRNKIDLRFSHGVSNCYQPAYQIIHSHRYPIEKMITHRWPLEQAQAALEDLTRRDGGHVKVVLECL